MKGLSLHEAIDGGIVDSILAVYPDALLIVDRDGTIVLANQAAVRLLQYPEAELIGLSVEALVPDGIRSQHRRYRDGYAQVPRTRPMGVNTNLVAKRRDGSVVPVEIALSPMQTRGLPYVIVAIRDVGDYPRVKQALKRARYAECLAQFGRFAVDGAGPDALLARVPTVAADALQIDGVVVDLLSPDGRTLTLVAGSALLPDERLSRSRPVDPAHPVGQVVATGQPVLVGDCRQDRRFAACAAHAQAGIASVLVLPLIDRGQCLGALTVRSRDVDVFNEEEQRFMESLASFVATALQRTRSEEALNHAQRLESVGHLTGGIAHDFNNLLTVISGSLQLVGDSPALAGDAGAQEVVDAALRATRRGAELTGKLLSFSRRQVLQTTVIDARALLTSMADMLRRTLDQRIEIRIDLPEGGDPAGQGDQTGDLLCLADPAQLESALLNIAINARDAMPAGGVLTFACRAVARLPVALAVDPGTAPAGDAGGPIESEAGDGYLLIAVGDTGSGMSAAVVSRAFEPFFTTKEKGRGTGLGLSTVYGFAKQSRGAVDLHSAVGVGTTVSLYLPRVVEEPMVPEALEAVEVSEVPQLAAGPGGSGALRATAVPPGLSVLLVEDDGEVRATVRRFLETFGADVVAVADAQGALAAIASGRTPDLLLTDVVLGAGASGTDLADQAQALHPTLPVVLMSGFAVQLLAGTRDRILLRKPFSTTELAEAVIAARSAHRG